MDTSDTDRRVAAAVSLALAEAGIRWHIAADETGIPRTTLRRRLEGHTSFTMSELARLAVLLGTDVTSLIDTPAGAA